MDTPRVYLKLRDTECFSNGWTIDVIAHIFSYMKWEDNNE